VADTQGLAMHRAILAAGLLGALAPAPAPAQEPGLPPRHEPRPAVRAAPPSRINVLIARRARLGLTVNLRATDSDSIGAYVTAVTPGGPAARAGIRSGDLITRLNGEPLVQPGLNVRADESGPGIRLVELAARLEPNDTIGIELRRGTERKTVQLVTGDEPILSWSTLDSSGGPASGWDDDPETTARRLAELGRTFKRRGDSVIRLSELVRVPPPGAAPRAFTFVFGSPLAQLELAPLNPDLGRYFGTSRGVLVISVPKQGRLGLKGGDVVLAVDGRAATSPAHLLRILQSYEDGEPFKLEIFRDRRKQVIVGSLAAADGQR
jgi:S1-C subfamily serine protease